MKKKVVIIGGGNGSALTINSLKKYLDELELSAIISMSDSGGSSGILREEFDTLPPGDIMRSVLAMSKYDYKMLKDIFYKPRFSGTGKLDKHNLGNLFLVLSERYCGDYITPLRALEQAVGAVGHVYPITLDKTDLVVELSNADVVRGEEAIDRPNYDRSLRIKRAWLELEGSIYGEAKRLIEEAEYIFIGPGSFYCSIISTLLQNGTSEAIKKSRAKLVFIAGNACEINGETGPKKLSEFAHELQKYLPRRIDAVIYNNHKLTDEEVQGYEKKGWALFEGDVESISDYNVISADYEREPEKGIGLSSERLGKILMQYIEEN